MQNYKEYHNFLKFKIQEVYKNEIEELNNKYEMYLNNEIDDLMEQYEKDDYVILILNYNEIVNTTGNVYKNIKKVAKDYKVLDISFTKIKDNVEFSPAFLVSIFFIKNDIYNSEPSKYNEIFKNKISKSKNTLNKIYLMRQIDHKYNVELNNLYDGRTSLDFEDIYYDFINKIIKHKKNIVFRLSLGRTIANIKRKLTGKQVTKVDYNSNNNVENKDISKEINTNDDTINNIRKLIVNSDNIAIVILSLNDEIKLKKYIDLFIKMNFFVINNTNKNNNEIKIKNYVEEVSLDMIKKITESFKVLYVIDENFNKEKINDCINNYVINDSEINNITVDTITSAILKDEKGISIFANLDHANSIKVLTSTFLDFEGTNYYSGGAERYLIDLHELCSEIGYKLRIYQKGNYEFMRYYEDIEVIGISDDLINVDESDVVNIKNNYDKIANNTTILNIYSALMECIGSPISPSIGISHGVAWDSKYNEFNDGKYFWNSNKWIIDSAKACDKVVSVDTNTPNWFQTIDFNLGSNMSVIPNYVDINQFYPVKNEVNIDDKIILTYPRRIYEARGMYLLLDIVDDILQKYVNIEIHFVGKGFKNDIDKVNEKIEKWGDRIKLYNLPPKKMHEMYKYTDISVIPTLYSEGTSLSCLEAMASGNAVISTRVGGLTDLVINNFNGKLIEPNSKSLYNAICEFMDNPEIMEKCRKNAIEVAKVFNKKEWKNKWKEVIKSMIDIEHSPSKIVEHKLLKIYLLDDYEFKNISNLVLEYLKNNYVVYIVTKSNVSKKDSFGRLQYVSLSQELYRKPDYVIADINMESVIKEKIDQYIN